MFLPFMCRLRFFEIYADLGPATMHDFDILSFLMGSLCMSLTSPVTLEQLKFNISFRGDTNSFDISSFYEDLHEAGVWSSITTGSRLQRVDINIDYCYLHDNGEVPRDHEVLKAVLDALPLLRTKDILFIKADSWNSCARYAPGSTGGTEYCASDVLPGTV